MLCNSDAAKAQSTARSWKARKTMSNNVHETKRDVTDEEKRLWREVREVHHTSDYEVVNVYQTGRQRLGMGHQRIRQLVATWENEGLVSVIDEGNNRAFLTEYGVQSEHIKSTGVRGESWR